MLLNSQAIADFSHFYRTIGTYAEVGFVNLEQAGSMAVIGPYSYHSAHRLARLSSAKADSST